jgi:hypothetical protein
MSEFAIPGVSLAQASAIHGLTENLSFYSLTRFLFKLGAK